MSVLRDESFYYQYEQNGGTMVMPKEVFWELYNDSKDETERLNSIINELEKWLENEIKFRKVIDKDFELRKALNILQILKGSNKK